MQNTTKTVWLIKNINLWKCLVILNILTILYVLLKNCVTITIVLTVGMVAM